MNTNRQNQKKELRQFGFILTLILSFFSWRLLNKELWLHSQVFLGLGTFSFILSIFAPLILRFPHRLLSFIAKYIGWVNTRIILSIIYYFIFTPVAIFFRIIKNDFLERFWDARSPSYWIIRKDVEPKKESYERQF